MLKNYLKTALRNIKKYKLYSFINIAGLAVGMACCILIFLWIQNEISYDRFHDHSDRLFKVVSSLEGEWTSTSPWAINDVLKRDYPEIIRSTRFRTFHFLTRYLDCPVIWRKEGPRKSGYAKSWEPRSRVWCSCCPKISPDGFY